VAEKVPWLNSGAQHACGGDAVPPSRSLSMSLTCSKSSK